MQGGIEECVQSQHAPKANQPVQAGNLAQWCDSERNKEHPQRPLSGAMGKLLCWICAEGAMETLPYHRSCEIVRHRGNAGFGFRRC